MPPPPPPAAFGSFSDLQSHKFVISRGRVDDRYYNRCRRRPRESFSCIFSFAAKTERRGNVL